MGFLTWRLPSVSKLRVFYNPLLRFLSLGWVVLLGLVLLTGPVDGLGLFLGVFWILPGVLGMLYRWNLIVDREVGEVRFESGWGPWQETRTWTWNQWSSWSLVLREYPKALRADPTFRGELTLIMEGRTIPLETRQKESKLVSLSHVLRVVAPEKEIPSVGNRTSI